MKSPAETGRLFSCSFVSLMPERTSILANASYCVNVSNKQGVNAMTKKEKAEFEKLKRKFELAMLIVEDQLNVSSYAAEIMMSIEKIDKEQKQ